MKVTAISASSAPLRQFSMQGYVMQDPLRTSSVSVIGEPESTPAPYLTRRQLGVLSSLCEGLPNKLIARKLNISEGTVKVHIGCILRELGVSSRLQAAISAHSLGLVGEPAASVTSACPDYRSERINHAAKTLGRRMFSAARSSAKLAA